MRKPSCSRPSANSSSTAADLRGALRWRAKEAAAVLDEIAEGREQDGFRIWAAP